MPEVREMQSIGDLFSEFADDVKILIRDEIEILKLEMAEKASRAGRQAGLIAAGGVVIFGGFLVLLAAVVSLLALAMQVWVAALIVGVITAGIGAYLIKKNLDDLKRANLMPTRTISSLKEDARWLKKQV